MLGSGLLERHGGGPPFAARLIEQLPREIDAKQRPALSLPA